jgi:hypothetical protein
VPSWLQPPRSLFRAGRAGFTNLQRVLQYPWGFFIFRAGGAAADADEEEKMYSDSMAHWVLNAQHQLIMDHQSANGMSDRLTRDLLAFFVGHPRREELNSGAVGGVNRCRDM